MVGNHYVYVQRNAVPFAGTFKWMSTNFHSMESVVTISSSTWISCIEADLVIGTANQGCSRTGTRLVSRYIMAVRSRKYSPHINNDARKYILCAEIFVQCAENL